MQPHNKNTLHRYTEIIHSSDKPINLLQDVIHSHPTDQNAYPDSNYTPVKALCIFISACLTNFIVSYPSLNYFPVNITSMRSKFIVGMITGSIPTGYIWLYNKKATDSNYSLNDVIMLFAYYLGNICGHSLASHLKSIQRT
jgi:uncharacterized membrane protein